MPNRKVITSKTVQNINPVGVSITVGICSLISGISRILLTEGMVDEIKAEMVAHRAQLPAGGNAQQSICSSPVSVEEDHFI